MSNQHTRGPWTTDQHGLGIYPVLQDGRSGPAVAMLMSKSGAFDNHEANARLIAAAPDLLDVLREIVGDGVHCDVVPHLHRRALEAIAKATGES